MRIDFGLGVRAVFGPPDTALPDAVAALEGLSLRDLMTAEAETSSSALRLLLRVLLFAVAAVLDEDDALGTTLVVLVAVLFVPDDFFVARGAIWMVGAAV